VLRPSWGNNQSQTLASQKQAESPEFCTLGSSQCLPPRQSSTDGPFDGYDDWVVELTTSATREPDVEGLQTWPLAWLVDLGANETADQALRGPQDNESEQ
jgi:hypothetical protein